MIGVTAFEVYLYTLTIAGLLEAFTQSSCVRYYHGNIFVVGTVVAGFVVQTVVNCLWTVHVVPVVKFNL